VNSTAKKITAPFVLAGHFSNFLSGPFEYTGPVNTMSKTAGPHSVKMPDKRGKDIAANSQGRNSAPATNAVTHALRRYQEIAAVGSAGGCGTGGIEFGDWVSSGGIGGGG
jgi:hypothetical protein